jgi:hypothetical protein
MAAGPDPRPVHGPEAPGGCGCSAAVGAAARRPRSGDDATRKGRPLRGGGPGDLVSAYADPAFALASAATIQMTSASAATRSTAKTRIGPHCGATHGFAA